MLNFGTHIFRKCWITIFIGIFISISNFAFGRSAEIDSTLYHSHSPDGRYAVEVQTLDRLRTDALRTNSGGTMKSPFLVRERPYKVVREITPQFRYDRADGAKDYHCYWAPKQGFLAVVMFNHLDTSIALLEKTSSGWKNIPLPSFDWVRHLNTFAESHGVKGSMARSCVIDSVHFSHHQMIVRAEGLLFARENRDVIFKYRYSHLGKHWKLKLISANAEPDL